MQVDSLGLLVGGSNGQGFGYAVAPTCTTRRQMVYSCIRTETKCTEKRFVLFYFARAELAARDVAIHDILTSIMIMSFK